MQIKPIHLKVNQRVRLAEWLRTYDSMLNECTSTPDGIPMTGTITKIDETSHYPIEVWFNEVEYEGGMRGGWWYFTDDSELELVE